jgi:hypothetical protein
MRRFSRLPSPAMAVAFVALLAALSGTAVALPGKNTVDSGDIKKGAVKAADIGSNAVRSKHVKDGSLLAKDFKAGQIPTGPQGPTGNTGPQGPQGPQGVQGQQGPAGTARAYGLINADATVNAQRSFKVGDIMKFGTGTYCVHLDPSIDISTVSAVASIRLSSGQIGVTPGGCSFGGASGIQINTYDATGGALDRAFTLLVG